jgi:hypothetical protein
LRSNIETTSAEALSRARQVARLRGITVPLSRALGVSFCSAEAEAQRPLRQCVKRNALESGFARVRGIAIASFANRTRNAVAPPSRRLDFGAGGGVDAIRRPAAAADPHCETSNPYPSGQASHCISFHRRRTIRHYPRALSPLVNVARRNMPSTRVAVHVRFGTNRCAPCSLRATRSMPVKTDSMIAGKAHFALNGRPPIVFSA